MGFPALVPQKKFSLSSYDKPFIDQAFLVKTAEYWLSYFYIFIDHDFDSSRSTKTQQKNLANIQPFCPNKLGQFWRVRMSEKE